MPARARARFLPCRPATRRYAALIRCRGSCASVRVPRVQADLAALVDQKHAVLAGGKPRALKANVRLARRAGLGVMTVRLRDGHVEVLADPGPYAARRSQKKKTRLLRAFDRLRGDPNDGGATRHGIITGYRQDALRCARFLAVHGPSKGAKVREWAEVPHATRIMAADHYGWFRRVSRGVYDLTDSGRQGLADYGDV